MPYRLIFRLVQTVFSGLLVAGLLQPATAQISPGKLSAPHQKLEGVSNCTKCHQLGAAVADEKCLGCHQAIAARQGQKRGYHASAEVVSRNCSACHQEHNGLEYKLIYWPQGQKAFDHSLAGYRLEGAHRERDCNACHQPAFLRPDEFKPDATVRPAKTYFGLNQACLTCHADEHGAQLTDRCQDCHSYQAWAPADKFKHDAAKYKLTGKHSQTGCAKCHPEMPRPALPLTGIRAQKANPDSSAQYQGLAFGNCSDCHKDVHQGRLGSNCAGCHTTEGFRTGVATQGFDHNRTAYPLQGKHLQVACNRCHAGGDMTASLKHGKCRDCHAEVHSNQFAVHPDGGACEACHSINGFSPSSYSIEAHNQCSYPLTGSHLAVPCNLCHALIKRPDGQPIARFDLKYKDCADCHKDVHQGQVNLWIERGGCAYCHQTETWHRTSFDHSLASFALDGKHREILCLKCHYIQVDGVGQQVWMKPLSKDCAGCHEDVHRGQFLKSDQKIVACERCHKTSGWTDLAFSHNRDSQFALDGAHEKVACRACHKIDLINSDPTTRYRPLKTRCADCHQQNEKAATK